MMRYSNNRRMLLGVLIVSMLGAAAPGWADASPRAQPWIEKLIALYEQGPFETDYVATLDMEQAGQVVNGAVRGDILWGGREHMRVEMSIQMSGMIPGAGDEATEMAILSVTDGENTWTDISIPAMGVRQVMKISIEAAKAMSEQQGSVMGGNPASMDPVNQLESLAKNLDFELVEIKDGKVYLTAEMDDEGKSQLGQLGSMPGANRLMLVLHEDTARPAEITIGGEKPLITMEFGAFEPRDEADLPADAFSYQPPEGIQVMDLGAGVQAVR